VVPLLNAALEEILMILSLAEFGERFDLQILTKKSLGAVVVTRVFHPSFNPYFGFPRCQVQIFVAISLQLFTNDVIAIFSY